MLYANLYIMFIEDCRPDSKYCPSKLYFENKFLAVQWALDSAILSVSDELCPLYSLVFGNLDLLLKLDVLQYQTPYLKI